MLCVTMEFCLPFTTLGDSTLVASSAQRKSKCNRLCNNLIHCRDLFQPMIYQIELQTFAHYLLNTQREIDYVVRDCTNCFLKSLGKAVVTSFDREMDCVILSLRTSLHPTRCAELVWQTVVLANDIDQGYVSESDEDETEDEADNNSYNERLQRDQMFDNPYAVENMANALGINISISSLSDRQYSSSDYYDRLRDRQNFSWAQRWWTCHVMLMN